MSCIKKNKAINNITGLLLLFTVFFLACKKNSSSPKPANPPDQTSFQVTSNTVNSISFNSTQTLHGININPAIRISFSDKVDRSTVSSAVTYNNKSQNLSIVP